MKKIGEYTTRGSIITDDSTNRIILFDGKFDTAYRVTSFEIAPHVVDSSESRNYGAKLMTDEDATTGTNWNWDNNEEIGWAMFNHDGNDVRSEFSYSRIDPDNLVVQDLYIRAFDQQARDQKLNYLITLEKYDITDSQGALAMVRNRSQA